MQFARLADCPAIAMTEAEAKTFLQAWQNYLRHYSVTATQRTIDLVTACGVTLFIYVPRGMALAERKRQGNRPQQPQPQAQVFRFHTAPQPVQPQPVQPEVPDIDGEAAEPVGGVH
jgi:hypothetical protein